MAKQDEAKNLVVVDYSDVTFSEIDDMVLNKKQFNKVMSKTPKKHLYERTAKGGGKWTYVKGGYVKKILNVAFGWNWDFQILKYEFDVNLGQAFVHGRLTVRAGGKTIIKEQFGRADIKFKNKWLNWKWLTEEQKQIWRVENNKAQPDNLNKAVKIQTLVPLDLGNDMKAASTDALKKCAAELGVCNDVYAPDDWAEVKAIDETDFDDVSVPQTVIEQIKSFDDEAKLRAFFMSYENRDYAKNEDFQNAINDKLEELWQRQDK